MRAIKPNAHRRSLWRHCAPDAAGGCRRRCGNRGRPGTGEGDRPEKLAFWREAVKPIPADWVAIPRCARPIEPYTKITAEYLTNPLTGRWLVTYVPPDKVPAGVILDPRTILFRVTAYEKKAGLFFSEADFLPPGSSPGVAGGTPEGKQAFTLDASRLKGIVYDLRAGDHVVLQASTAVDMPGAGHSNGGRFGANVAATPEMLLRPKRSIVTTVVKDGVVVIPARTRNLPISSTSLTQGMTTRTVPVQEIVIAVDPDEVRLLSEALELKYEITCTAQSGRPASPPPPVKHGSDGAVSQVFTDLAKAVLGADGATAPGKAAAPSGKTKTVNHPKSETPAKDPATRQVTPGLDPLAEYTCMEVMIGTQRQLMFFTRPGSSPVVASQDDGSAKAGAGEESKQ